MYALFFAEFVSKPLFNQERKQFLKKDTYDLVSYLCFVFLFLSFLLQTFYLARTLLELSLLRLTLLHLSTKKWFTQL